MILAGTEIGKEVEAGNITIDPYEPKHLNPASIDLTLGRGVTLYEGTVFLDQDSEGDHFDGSSILPFRSKAIDVRVPPRVRRFEIPDEGWLVLPNIAYLMHTAERVTTDKYVPIVDGKSSLGRLFLSVHQTAGFGDPGFDGEYTLEVTSLFPVRLYPGMRVCQMRFHTILGTPVNYRDVGHYVGDKARGAVASEVRVAGFNGK